MCMHYKGPSKKEEELEEEDDEEGFGLPAVIDTGMFNVKVHVLWAINKNVCVDFPAGWSCWRRCSHCNISNSSRKASTSGNEAYVAQPFHTAVHMQVLNICDKFSHLKYSCMYVMSCMCTDPSVTLCILYLGIPHSHMH